jgi:hypothetical protein
MFADLWPYDNYSVTPCRLMLENKDYNCKRFRKKLWAPKVKTITPTLSMIGIFKAMGKAHCPYCKSYRN